MFLYTSRWCSLSKWCSNTNTQLLLLFHRCQNFVSCVTINGAMWADVALTVSFLHWAAWQAGVTSAFLEYWILFHPAWHSSGGSWGHCGWAGAVQELWTTPAELCSQLPPSVWSWNLKYLTDFLESVEETHFSSHRCPLQALMMFIPDFSPCLLWHQASLTAAPLWFLPQLCSHKASDKTGCQNQMDGSLQTPGCLEFQGRVFLVRWRCFRA